MNSISKYKKIIEESYTSNNILLEWPFGKKNQESSGTQRGIEKRNNLVSKMNDSWDEWLATTGLEGTQRDMINFLISRVGFSKSDTLKILDMGVNNPIIDKSTEEDDNRNQVDDKKEDETSDKKEEDDNRQEKKEPRIRPNGYAPLRSSVDYETAYHNLDYGLSRKNKTSVDNDELEKSYNLLISNYKEIPKEELSSINDILKDTAEYFNSLSKVSKYYMSDSEIASSLFNIQKHTNSLADGRIINSNNKLFEASFLDQPLTKNEIQSIFADAASFAFANNLIGNKNYARTNGIDVDNEGERRSNSNSQELTKPAERANFMTNFNSKVFATAVNTGGINQDDIERLRANSKTSWDTVQLDDYPDYARLGWSFLRSLGR